MVYPSVMKLWTRVFQAIVPPLSAPVRDQGDHGLCKRTEAEGGTRWRHKEGNATLQSSVCLSIHSQAVTHHPYSTPSQSSIIDKALSVHLSIHTQPVIHHRYTHFTTHLPISSPIHLPTHPLI